MRSRKGFESLKRDAAAAGTTVEQSAWAVPYLLIDHVDPPFTTGCSPSPYAANG